MIDFSYFLLFQAGHSVVHSGRGGQGQVSLAAEDGEEEEGQQDVEEDQSERGWSSVVLFGESTYTPVFKDHHILSALRRIHYNIYLSTFFGVVFSSQKPCMFITTCLGA